MQARRRRAVLGGADFNTFRSFPTTLSLDMLLVYG
jgi:hypothetical protein